MKRTLRAFYFFSFLLYLAFSTILYAETNEGLVGYYPFNGNANDESENGNDGTVNGAILVEDRHGNPKASYSLDGIDDYINIGTSNSLNLRDSFSVSIWFNVDDLDNDVNLFSRGGFAFDDQLFCQARLTMEYSDIHCRFSVDGSVGTEINTEKIPWEVERWYNLIITKSLTEKKIKYYLNGEQVREANFPGTLHSSNKPFLIGWNQNDHVNKYFDGVIDDIRIYNRSLSEVEIMELYSGSMRILNPQNGHYYQRFDKPMSWHEAVNFCNNLGAHLVTITSKDENLFVYENFDTKNENKCWIGATDENQEGKWEWVTGEEWKFTNWDGGEPNNSTYYDENGEDYIHIFWILAENGTWNDIHGSSSFEYDNKNYFEVPICEWDKQLTYTDSDDDGVIDQWDNCPKTPANSCVNNKGCSCEQSIIHEKGSVSKGKWKTYYANIAKTYSNFIVKIQDLTDDIDLYVKKGNKPDVNNYDCRPYKGGKREEICELSNNDDNLWYFCIYGYKAGDFTISVKANR